MHFKELIRLIYSHFIRHKAGSNIRKAKKTNTRKKIKHKKTGTFIYLFIYLFICIK